MSRPDYLETDGVPPPSQSPKKRRATVEYRCDRLVALVNLYHWTMQWTLHASEKWQLGEKAYRFELREKQLWALGIETLEQAAKQSWSADLHVIRVTVQQKRPPRRTGVIILSNVKWGQYLRSLTAVATKGDKFDHQPAEFLHEDLVLRITFSSRPSCVPWDLISSMLRQAYVNTEDDLKDARIEWGGPPFYEEFITGQELLVDATDRGLRPRVLLRNLERHRRKFVRDAEAVLRANVPGRKRRKRRKRGTYQTGNSPREDAKLHADWKASQFRRIVDFCHKRNLDPDDVRAALDRHRKRD